MGMWLPPTVVVIRRIALLCWNFRARVAFSFCAFSSPQHHRERFIVSRYLLALVDAGGSDFQFGLSIIGLMQSGASRIFV